MDWKYLDLVDVKGEIVCCEQSAVCSSLELPLLSGSSTHLSGAVLQPGWGGWGGAGSTPTGQNQLLHTPRHISGTEEAMAALGSGTRRLPEEPQAELGHSASVCSVSLEKDQRACPCLGATQPWGWSTQFYINQVQLFYTEILGGTG